MRKTIYLNGEYDFMPVYGIRCSTELPEKLTWENNKIRVPSSWRWKTPEGFGDGDDFKPFDLFEYPQEWSNAETGVYRRFFKTPEGFEGKRAVLTFEGLMQTAGIYLNGELISEWDEAYLPLSVDITQNLNPVGEDNELMVVCSTFKETKIPSGETKVMGLKGSWFGIFARGIWQDVKLDLTSMIYIDDIYIRTSFREKKIYVEYLLKNESCKEKQVSLSPKILDKNKIALVLPKQELVLQPGEERKVKTEALWADALLWQIDNPYLYDLSTDLTDSEGNQIDQLTERFGFREVWFEGSKLMINGIRINLRGDSWHFQGAVQQTKEYALNWFNMCKQYGVNCIRLHAEPYPKYYLEAADETGMLIIDETAIYGSSKTMDAANPQFIENCKKHMQRLVMRDRNHPSVIVWSIQNEMRWVDGRDVYKKSIPDLIHIAKSLDPSRPSYIEGDNRLISVEGTDIVSYHYNIDGTIEQWDRSKPLIVGEHGGWWYVCPQNASAYIGLSAYDSSERSGEGFAVREKLFAEYCRRNEVTGFSTFNFAHYLARSMPEKDIYLDIESTEESGVKPVKIPKYSLTINNGMLKDYPAFKPNSALRILEEVYRPVVVIPVQYDNVFYGGTQVTRSFDIYNDTTKAAEAKIKIDVLRSSGETIAQQTCEFLQIAGEKKECNINITFPEIQNKEKIMIMVKLYHDDKEMYCYNSEYTIHPSSLKNNPIEAAQHISIGYIGGLVSYEKICLILPKVTYFKNINDMVLDNIDVMIVGAYFGKFFEDYSKMLDAFTKRGGRLVVLEQSRFVPKTLGIYRSEFFSAHISDPSHPIIKDISDEELIFWKPYVNEDRPSSIIRQCFKKPEIGSLNMILECSEGDFGDGGDLWTPLMEIKNGKGMTIFNQLEIMSHLENVPTAIVLLRNILEYAISYKHKQYVQTAVLCESKSGMSEMLELMSVEYDEIKSDNLKENYLPTLMIADANDLLSFEANSIRSHIEAGATLLVVNSRPEHSKQLEAIAGSEVKVGDNVTYHLKRNILITDNSLLKGVSPVDLCRFEKCSISPRIIENNPIAITSIEAEGFETLFESVEGTAWKDFFVNKREEEYSRRALVEINLDKKSNPKVYTAQMKIGKGKLVLCQISTDTANEKNVRIYSKLFANLGAELKCGYINEVGLSSYDGAIDNFMTLPYHTYLPYEVQEAYYSDPEYSLNNLGEGLYGWMKKIEKDKQGFINIENSVGGKFFATCFVNYVEEMFEGARKEHNYETDIHIATVNPFKLWINGKQITFNISEVKDTYVGKVPLIKGINRLAIVLDGDKSDVKFKVIFKDKEGFNPEWLRYTTKIDEVDPK